MPESVSSAESMKIDVPWSPTPRISVIIPATSGEERLVSCLRSLVGPGTGDLPFETIVILNKAVAESEARLRNFINGVQFLASPANLGMAGAGNRGRSHARGELLVTLHDDAEVEPGWLAALVDAADKHPHAGAIGGKVLGFDGRLQSAGMILWRDAYTSPPWVGEPPDSAGFDRLRAVDYCGSSSLLVRAAAWDAVGGLDELFYPAYYVDVDLSMALRTRGWVVLYQPKSRIRHHQGASTNRRFRAFIAETNRRLFLEKWAEQLEEYEAPERKSLAAVERAMARAEDRAAQKIMAVSVEAPLPRASLDERHQTRRHFEKAHDLRKAYVAHLGNALEREKLRPNRKKTPCARNRFSKLWRQLWKIVRKS